MHPSSNCPSDESLSRFLSGHLESHALETIADHVETCSDCQTRLEQFDCDDASVDQLVRKQVEAPAEDSEWQQLGHAIAHVNWAEPSDARSDDVGGQDKRVGNYLLTAPLGQGGMGTVFRAKHQSTGAEAAVKFLHPKRLADRIAIERFEREMVALGSLDHPHIVRALDAGEDEGTHYLVMEYVDGIDFGKVCGRINQLHVNQSAEVIRQAALGLEYVHQQGRIHRDIKPSNLMLSRTGQVKVLDLGLARVEELPAEEPATDSDNILGTTSHDLTQTHQIMGTLAYMAPEQAVDSRSVDHRADIYALGGTFYKLLTGSSPFGNSTSPTAYSQVLAHLQKPIDPVCDIRPDVPIELGELIGQMLAKDPDDRPQSAGEVASRLLPFAKGGDLQSLIDIGQGVPPASADTIVDPSTQRGTQRDTPRDIPDARTALHGDDSDSPNRKRWIGALAISTLIVAIAGLAFWSRTAPHNGLIMVRAASDDLRSAIVASGAELIGEGQRIPLTIEPMQLPVGSYEVLAGRDTGLRFSPSTFELTRGRRVILEAERRPRVEPDSTADGTFTPPRPPPPPPPSAPESISLISLVDPQRDIRADDWVRNNDGTLESQSDRVGYMKFPYRPPSDYRVDLLVERIEADDCLILGLTGGDRCYPMCFDTYPDEGWASGISQVSNQRLPERGSFIHRGQLLKPGEPTLISAEVHHDAQRISIQVNVQGKTVFQWRGSQQNLTPFSSTSNPPHHSPSTLFLSNWKSKFLVSDFQLTSLEGKGEAIDFTDPKLDRARAAAELALWKGGKVSLLDESPETLLKAQIPKPVGGFELIKTFDGHRGRVKTLAISKDGKYAASGSGWPSGDRTVRVWDIEAGTEKHSFNAGFNVMFVEFSPDGQSIAATGLSDQIRVWDVESGEPVLDARLSNVSAIEELHYSPDGSEFVVAFKRQAILVVADATTGEETRRIPIPSFTLGFTFLPQEETLAVGYGNGSIGLIDYQSGAEKKLLRRPPLPGKVNSVHHVPSYCLDVSRDGKLVAAGYRGQYSGHIWDLETGKPLVNFQTADRGPEQIFFTPDGGHLVLSGSNGVVSLIEVATGHVVGSTEQIESHGWAMGMMPDGESVLVGGGPANNSLPFFNPSGDFGIRLWKLGRADAEVLAKANEPVRPVVTIDRLSKLPDELKLIGIDLSGSRMIRDQDLARISDLDQLESLKLSETETTEGGFGQMGQLPNLQTLSLAGTKAQSLPPDFGSRFPKLTKLDLHSTGIKRVDPEAIADLRSLESLNLSSTPIETAGVEAFSRLSSLQQIDLSATTLSDAAMASLAKMENLRELNIRDAEVEGTESLLRGDWPALQRLDLINSEVSKEQLDAFRTRHSDVAIASPYDTVDLIPLIDLSRHAPGGKWSKQDGVLKSVGGQCVLPVELPESFEIRTRVRRTAGRNSPIFQFPLSDGTDVMIGFDHWPAEGPFVILHGIDGKMERASPVKTTLTSLPAQRGATCDLTVKVEHVGEAIEIAASVNDEPVLEWKGAPSRLFPAFYGLNKFQPSIVNFSSVEVLSLELTPLSGAIRLEGSDKQRTRLDREVATWVLERGGNVGITEIDDDSQRDERIVSNLDDLPETPFWVTQIDRLFGVRVPADWFQKVAKLKRLESIGLQHSQFNNTDLAHLRASRSIRDIQLWYSPINDEGAKQLSQMKKLTAIKLQHSTVTADGINCFRNHPSLQNLTASVRSDVSADVALTIPTLKRFDTLSPVTEETLEKIAGLKQLNSLSIRDSAGLSSNMLEPVLDQKRLKHLWLQHGSVDASIVESISRLDSLIFLDLADNPIGLGGAVPLSSLRNLRTLLLDDTGIGDESVAAISMLPRLVQLNLSGNPAITDRCVPDLSRLTSLKTLDLHRTGISEQGLRTLQSKLSNCTISPLANSINTPESSTFQYAQGMEGLWWSLRSRSPRQITLSGELLNDQSIPLLIKQHQLQSVTLNQTRVSADALIELAALPNLERLIVVPLKAESAPPAGERTVDQVDEPIARSDSDRVREAFPDVTVEFLSETPKE